MHETHGPVNGARLALIAVLRPEIDGHVRGGVAFAGDIAAVDPGHSCGSKLVLVEDHHGTAKEQFGKGDSSVAVAAVIVGFTVDAVVGASGPVVEGDLVTVGVGKGEGAPKWASDRGRDNRVAIGDESVVNRLDISGMEPDRGADAGLSHGREIGAWNDVSKCERDRGRLKHNGVGRARR